MDRLFVALGSLLGLLSVGAGAFGAHALRERLAPALLSAFQTGAQYQMYHALALLLVAALLGSAPVDGTVRARRLTLAGGLLCCGSLLFSGSLYALALTGLRPLGAVTPVGGLLQMAGWATLAWSARRT